MNRNPDPDPAGPAAAARPQPRAPVLPRRALVFAGALTLILAAFWVLPRVWYTARPSDGPTVWLAEVTNAPGWTFTPQAIGESAESVLAADALFYGEYSRPSGELIRLFTAKRFRENPHEIGLFVHTPDRCWTEAGWRIQPVAPDLVTVNLGRLEIPVERRLFTHSSGGNELVYFFGLVGGRPLPYRLDHNLGVGQRLRLAGADGDAAAGTRLRATDNVLWTRVWESFWSRRPLLGPKEFVRISTPVFGNDIGRADALLQGALDEVIVPRPYGPQFAKARGLEGGSK
jgi:hypothetical protein